jgi:O-antigen/teichoic acid export membrane protein
MRKFEKIQIIKNVGSSWFSLGVNIVTGLFLSPFILHRLGDTAFGIWVLIFSLTGYYGLFDLGIRSSIVRYVSKYTATDDKEGLARLVNTSLFGYSCIGAISLVVTALLVTYVDHIFRIPPDFYATARWLLIMVGISVALGFPLGIFGGFLEGIQRFDVMNWTNIVFTILRTVLVILFLDRGYGLLTVAFITVLLPLITAIVRGVWAFKLVPVPLGTRYLDRETFRHMLNFGGATFIIMLAGRLKFRTDEMVIGTFVSAAAVTYFNVGARITDYAREVVVSLSQIFMPMSSQSEAQGKMERLRKILVAGNRACAFIVFPVCAVLLILGKSIIQVWMGKKYVVTSYPILVIMIIPMTLMLAQSASGRVLMGVGKHKSWALISLCEGLANLGLSIWLVHPYGIVGDAFGTAIPLTLSMTLYMPRYVCRTVGIRVRDYLREAYVLPALVAAPVVAILLLLRYWFVAQNYRQLGFQLLVAGLVYTAGMAWVYYNNQAFTLRKLVPVERPPKDKPVVASHLTEAS